MANELEVKDPGNIDVEGMLSDIQNMTEEELKAEVDAISDDSEEIKEPEAPHIKLSTVDLLFHLKLFSSMNKSLQDVVSRALLFEVGENQVKSTMSDGIFRGSVLFPHQGVTEGFPECATLDYDSLVKVARSAGKTLYLVFENKSFYIDFFGGRVHIPSFKISKDMILGRVKVAEERETTDVPAVNFLQVVSISSDFLASNQLPNLQFMFVRRDGIYLSNGFTVLKLKHAFSFDCSIRNVDLPFVQAAIQISIKEGLQVGVQKDRLIISSSTVELVLPMVNENFPPSYEQQLNKFDTSRFFAIDFSKFYLLLSVLSKVYRSSGVVSIKSKEGVLYLESKSLDDDVSFMVLSKSMTGKFEDFELSFSVGGLMSVIRSLKHFSYLNLTVSGGTFCLFNDLVNMVVFGTETSVKSDMFRMKKDGRKEQFEKERVAKNVAKSGLNKS